MVICLKRCSDCLRMAQLMPLHPKTPSFLASFKSRLVLPFWYRLTRVPGKEVVERVQQQQQAQQQQQLTSQPSLVDIGSGEVGGRQQTWRDHLQGGRGGGRGDDRRRHTWPRQGATRHHGQRQRLRRTPRPVPRHRLPTVAQPTPSRRPISQVSFT